MNIYAKLVDNVSYLKKNLPSDDVNFISFNIKRRKCALIFSKSMADKTAVGELILKPLEYFQKRITCDNLFNSLIFPDKERKTDLSSLPDDVSAGKVVLLTDGLDEAFLFNVLKIEKRAISEPPTSTVIKGPREGFVESLPVNISLMRKRLKTKDLVVKNLTVGKYSKTLISVVYVKGIADDKLVKTLTDKINKINIDAILDSSYVAKYLGEHRTSIFKQVGNTEKPDILTAKILEGRVAVFVDGSPIALTVPYLLIEDFQSPSDYYSSPYSASFSRIIRLVSTLISVLLPAFFVSAELFHLQLIPLSFLLTIVNSIKGIPLSPSYEMFFTLIIFEILNETSVRMPRHVGMVVSIVGGLVLGETAVTAGIISAPTLMIIALSGICLYTVPELEQTFSILRLLFLLAGGSIGGYGIILLSAIMIIYFVSFENFSTPLLAPFSPLVPSDLKDSFYKGFLPEFRNRPLSIRTANRKRISKKNDKGESA